MARMTRTQVSLEERQYLFLKSRAAESGSSLSAVLRELIDQEIARQPEGTPSLLALAGAWEGGGVSGADHDRLLADLLEGRTSEPGA